MVICFPPGNYLAHGRRRSGYPVHYPLESGKQRHAVSWQLAFSMVKETHHLAINFVDGAKERHPDKIARDFDNADIDGWCIHSPLVLHAGKDGASRPRLE
jgi:hypothetical protein